VLFRSATVAAAFRNPLLATLAVLAIVAVFWHLRLGLQVVIEDYIHIERSKIAVQLAVTFAVFLVGALCLLSVLKLFFGV
jgi:succinate dehydrogenase / fumarate reductase membrane anchor subunit